MTPKDFVKKRLQALGKTQRQLAESMGVREAAVSLLLSGNRTLSAKDAADLAHFLDLDIHDILEAFSLPISRRTPRVFLDARITDAGIASFEGDAPSIQSPAGVAFSNAFLVATDTLEPRYLRGEVLFTDAANTHPAGHVGRECVLTTPDGRRFGRLLRAEEGGAYTVASGARQVEFGVRVTAAEPVVWHRPAS